MLTYQTVCPMTCKLRTFFVALAGHVLPEHSGEHPSKWRAPGHCCSCAGCRDSYASDYTHPWNHLNALWNWMVEHGSIVLFVCFLVALCCLRFKSWNSPINHQLEGKEAALEQHHRFLGRENWKLYLVFWWPPLKTNLGPAEYQIIPYHSNLCWLQEVFIKSCQPILVSAKFCLVGGLNPSEKY